MEQFFFPKELVWKLKEIQVGEVLNQIYPNFTQNSPTQNYLCLITFTQKMKATG